jgi:uncharacterized membrane protein
MTVVEWIRAVAVGIDVFGVLIIVLGIGWAAARFAGRLGDDARMATFKIRVGRTLLLGLEVLVAADIVKTVALEATFASLAVLAGLVVIRTFLSWTLVLEIDGRWPWQPDAAPQARPLAGAGGDEAAHGARPGEGRMG